MSELRLRDLRISVAHQGRQRELLRGVDLSVAPGETLGLVGESGSGKSMTGRSTMALFPQHANVTGSVRFAGREILEMSTRELRQYRAREVAMIFQDARAHINPTQRIGDFLCEGMHVALGLSRKDARSRASMLLERVGMTEPGQRMRQFPHELSGGLLRRVMIASALAVRPKLLIADEPTTGLDVSTQNDVLHLVKSLQADLGISLIFITHDLEVAAAVCDRTAVIYAGEVVEIQDSSTLHDHPRHPYTAGLIGARPDMGRRLERLAAIPGVPISASEAPARACAFQSRCRYAVEACCDTHPELYEHPHGSARCIRQDELVLRPGRNVAASGEDVR